MQNILMFCRVTLGLVFTLSVLGKIRDFASFRQTIQTFDLLPKRLVKPFALVFLIGELAVIGLMLLSGEYLTMGFLLASTLLIVFSSALVSVLKRRIVTFCNCFGPSRKIISSYDLLRNMGFILFAVVGLILNLSAETTSLAWIEIAFITLMSIVFILIWTNLDDIAQLFLIKGDK